MSMKNSQLQDYKVAILGLVCTRYPIGWLSFPEIGKLPNYQHHNQPLGDEFEEGRMAATQKAFALRNIFHRLPSFA